LLSLDCRVLLSRQLGTRRRWATHWSARSDSTMTRP
jgi:hypothetical protein